MVLDRSDSHITPSLCRRSLLPQLCSRHLLEFRTVPVQHGETHQGVQTELRLGEALTPEPQSDVIQRSEFHAHERECATFVDPFAHGIDRWTIDAVPTTANQ